jgi:hypothetical protein
MAGKHQRVPAVRDIQVSCQPPWLGFGIYFNGMSVSDGTTRRADAALLHCTHNN